MNDFEELRGFKIEVDVVEYLIYIKSLAVAQSPIKY